MKISVITLFPKMFDGPFCDSIIGRAVKKKLLTIEFVDLMNYGIGKHKLVDDTPYGGGKGMLLRVDVVSKAIEKTKEKKFKNSQKVVLLTAHGKVFNQKIAKNYSKLKHLIVVCGHYEGFDKRIEKYVDENISVGDFILTGGEIPAMLIVDSVARLVLGVIKKDSSKFESFSPMLEYPQYTKPPVFDDLRVPKILLSGNHKKIEEWRKNESIKITKRLRPDLIEKVKN